MKQPDEVSVQIVYRPKAKWAKYTVYVDGKRAEGKPSLNAAINLARRLLETV